MTDEIINLEGWKGESGIEVSELTDKYRVIEWRQEKDTKEVKEMEHVIPKKNVELIWRIIQEHIPLGEVYTSKYLARKLIQHYGWDKTEGFTEDQMLNALWGGKYRSLMYFPHLYWPIKVLEKKLFIHYGGRGQITRLQ